MKKFMRICAITAFILIAAGSVAGIAASSIQGPDRIGDVVSSVTGDRLHVGTGAGDTGNWGLWFGDALLDSLGKRDMGGGAVIRENMDFMSGFPVLSGRVQDHFTGAGIDSLDVEVGACHMVLGTSADGDFHVEAENVGKMQCFVQDGTLCVKAVRKTRAVGKNDCEITLLVPGDFRFGKADLEIGAGVLELENLNVREADISVGAGRISCGGLLRADELKLEIGAGEILVGDLEAGKLEAEVGMGNLILLGAGIEKRANIECAMGTIEMKLKGGEKDYDYSLETSMGGIEIGDYSLSGLAGEKKIDNKAGRDVILECSMGNITIGFTE